MKNKIFIVLVALSMVFTFGGCKKTSEELFGSISAQINSEPWNSTLAAQAAFQYSNYITILGIDLQGKEVYLVIKGTTAGTYTLAILQGTTTTGAAFRVPVTGTNNKTEYISSAGSITITSITDNRISGTFQFTAATTTAPITTVQVTNGTFTNVLLVKQNQ
jgi:hypothetical protein